ncbi:MAG: tetratricopeptide repeat protein [Thermoanaerobaculales bacterium]|nr:tetratricopeptide repeat protein [Thermoanaerobaculales bacterium]
MRAGMGVLGAALVAVLLGLAVTAPAVEPSFARWLVAGDPGDEAIRDYWQRAEAGELAPEGLVDLGTMLFARGFTTDAVKTYRRALDADKELYEAWFLIGLAEHSRGELADAGEAYRRCLKKRPGHGWANFYLGLLEEQLGDSADALRYYEKAFTHAPELADPRVNPEVLSSELALGAQLATVDGSSFKSSLPLGYLQPEAVNETLRRIAEEGPVPAATAAPEPVAPAAGATPAAGVPAPAVAPSPAPAPAQAPPPTPAVRRVPTRAPTSPEDGSEPPPAGEAPYGAPVTSTSGEARLLPLFPGVFRAAEAFV